MKFIDISNLENSVDSTIIIEHEISPQAKNELLILGKN